MTMRLGIPATLLTIAAVTVLAAHVFHDATGFGSPELDAALDLWFQPAVFLASGVVTLARARAAEGERIAWSLLGTGLVLYALGSVYYALEIDGGPARPFPSPADALWLSLYPLSLACIAMLLRRRFRHVAASVWLDGAIGGTVVATVVAGALFGPMFAVSVQDGAASVARLAYPLGDLISLGFVAVVWSLSGRRSPASWVLLGAGFALLTLADSVYVVQAAHGTWTPGGPTDLPYALGTMALAAAAWAAPRGTREQAEALSAPVILPVMFAVVAAALTALAVVGLLNPLASALALTTLAAVVCRLAVALTSLTRQRAALAARASTDALTGLANHRAFHERLGEELGRARRTGRPLAVMLLDLDRFKALNDTFGHAQGDRALQAVARALADTARPYDVVGRVGGEEFALVLPEVTGEEASAAAERCRLAVSSLRVQDTPLSCSVGVAAFPADDSSGDRLLERADAALYSAKRGGRAQVRRYDPRDSVRLSSRAQAEEIRALLRHDDVLSIAFQPVVELSTGRVAGYEALARFGGGEPPRPPDAWFAQARRCGLGGPLEARAIAQALAVPGRPPHTFLSLNVSPAGLLSPEVGAVLPEDLTDLLIELTEDDLFSSEGALDQRIAELRERGARIAVDDAGAGYAGLQQVVRVKPDVLKLDRSLISGIHADGAKTALLEAMARFAVSTGAAVCAEGVEDLEELRVVARSDVTYAQGHALGRPGAPWPAVTSDAAGRVASQVRWGMRVTSRPRASASAPGLGDVTDVLARVRTLEDLGRAVTDLRRLFHADDVAVSRVLFPERCVETLSEHTWGPTGERYDFDDYPTTERVLVDQVVGQILDGDPEADPAELALLRRDRFATVLLAPILFRGATVGLLEVFRRVARPWTAIEADQVRVLTHHLGPALVSADLAAATRPALTPS